VIPAADARGRLLSFANLCELHVLSAIRREHRVSLPTVRESLDDVQQELASDRHLLERDLLTNGVSLFVEHASQHASQLVDVSHDGQSALRGKAIRLFPRFPFTRTRDAGDDMTVADPPFQPMKGVRA
jgi:hypothetical protein